MASIATSHTSGATLAALDQETIYSQIHKSILSFPDHTTAWHADKLLISPAEFVNLANTITRWPNTFWGYGPFKNNENGWSMDYSKKTSKKISFEEENKILRKRIQALEIALASATQSLQKYIEIEKRENAKKVACFTSTKFATGVLH